MKIKQPKKIGFLQRQAVTTNARQVLTGLCAIIHTEQAEGIYVGDALLQRFGELNKIWLTHCIQHSLTYESTQALQSFYDKLIAGEFDIKNNLT